MRIYFDHNATAPLSEGVAEAMAGVARTCWGNPSSVHAEGRAARDALEASRRTVAAALGAAAEDLVFTSGGTEADILGVAGLLRGAGRDGAGPVIATSELEHPAVLGAVRAAGESVFMQPEPSGRIPPEALERALERAPTVVTLQLANHELGTLQEVAKLASLAHEHGARVHCDAVQALGRMPIDVAALGVDSLAVSAHKVGGPKGVGALWLAPGGQWEPRFHQAGHQERGRRPGTEAVVAAAGFAYAVVDLERRLAMAPQVRTLSQALEDGLLGLGACLQGVGAERVGNTVNARFAGASADVLVAALDLEGISVSTGAACTSGSIAASPVLLALGMSEAQAREAVRFSLGPGNSAAEVKAVLEALPAIVARARRFEATR